MFWASLQRHNPATTAAATTSTSGARRTPTAPAGSPSRRCARASVCRTQGKLLLAGLDPASLPFVGELHKLLIEDDARHARSFVWSVALKGFVNTLEGGGEVVAHGDAMPPAAAAAPPPRGAVAVERLEGGAAWLMTALSARDARIAALQERC